MQSVWTAVTGTSGRCNFAPLFFAKLLKHFFKSRHKCSVGIEVRALTGPLQNIRLVVVKTISA